VSYSLSTVFCDDIRLENNGKLLLIGVYQDFLIPAFLPQTLGLSFWLRLGGVDKGVHEIHLTIGVDESVQNEINVKLDIQSEGQPAHVHLIGIPVQLNSPSKIFVEVTGLQDQNQALKSFLEVRPVQEIAPSKAA
jgi:hypothetical protein